MIEASLDFIQKVNYENDLCPTRVLDVGSKDRNLKDGARALFPGAEYIGVDLEEGPNVDLMVNAYYLERFFSKKSFDAVLCLHVFEHLGRPWVVLDQVDRILVDGGLLYVSMPTIGYPVHNHPGDYWRITNQGMQEIIMEGYEILAIEDAFSTYSKHPFINCVGRKK